MSNARMINTRSYHGEAEGDIYCSVKGDHFYWNMTLIMIHTPWHQTGLETVV